jgi:hypothetical protein
MNAPLRDMQAAPTATGCSFVVCEDAAPSARPCMENWWGRGKRTRGICGILRRTRKKATQIRVTSGQVTLCAAQGMELDGVAVVARGG